MYFWCVVQMASPPAFGTYGDTAPELAVFLDWELKDETTGAVLSEGERADKFRAWLSRMMVRHMKWTKAGDTGSDKWVDTVISRIASPVSTSSCRRRTRSWCPGPSGRPPGVRSP